MAEIIYILTNEAMPDYVKIGFTHGDVKERLKQLDRTGVPLPFEVYYAATVENAEKDEKWLHSIFADRRARDSREFFKMNPEYAALALKRVEIRETKVDSGLTPEQEKEVDEVKERRSRFHFEQHGIPVGSKLTFTRDPNIVAEVVENDKIKIDGKAQKSYKTCRIRVRRPNRLKVAYVSDMIIFYNEAIVIELEFAMQDVTIKEKS
jgi:hypothetical protein